MENIFIFDTLHKCNRVIDRTKTVFYYGQVNLKTFRYFTKSNVLWCIIKSLYNDKVNLRDLNLGKKRNFNFLVVRRWYGKILFR